MKNEDTKDDTKVNTHKIKTERVKGFGTPFNCNACKCYIDPKRIVFRTIRPDGTILYNYFGLNGLKCFIQCDNYFFCDICVKKYSGCIADVLLTFKSR